MSSDFSFPALPKPKSLPKQNPLLAGATVIDRSTGPRREEAAAAAPEAAGPAAQPAGAAAQAGAAPAAMGAALGQPVVLTRHQRGVPGGRRKVPFEIGYSQMDWVRLTQTHPDLAGLGGGPPRRGITMDEVARHCTKDDAWTVLRGKVFNITHYLRFHPGGVPLLLKVAGKDGTALFTKYHAWVNFDFMLAKCLVGLLAPPSAAAAAPASGLGIAGAAAEEQQAPAAAGTAAAAADGRAGGGEVDEAGAAGKEGAGEAAGGGGSGGPTAAAAERRPGGQLEGLQASPGPDDT